MSIVYYLYLTITCAYFHLEFTARFRRIAALFADAESRNDSRRSGENHRGGAGNTGSMPAKDSIDRRENL